MYKNIIPVRRFEDIEVFAEGRFLATSSNLFLNDKQSEKNSWIQIPINPKIKPFLYCHKISWNLS